LAKKKDDKIAKTQVFALPPCGERPHWVSEKKLTKGEKK
jgi:hypothetical protein